MTFTDERDEEALEMFEEDNGAGESGTDGALEGTKAQALVQMSAKDRVRTATIDKWVPRLLLFEHSHARPTC